MGHGWKWGRRWLLAALAWLGGLGGLGLTSAAMGFNNTIVVTSAVDQVAIDGGCSLREAVQAANTSTTVNECFRDGTLRGNESIGFSTALSGSSISLVSGPLAITSSMTIAGLGPDWLAVSGNHLSAVFDIGPHVVVTITQLSVFNAVGGDGGAFRVVESTLALSHCSVRYNTAALGAGLYGDESNISLADCVFSHNQASQNGGAAHLTLSALGVQDTVFSDNHAANRGGGLHLEGNSQVALHSTLFADNGAVNSGGALFNGDASFLTINDSSFGANSSHQGGAVTTWASTLEVADSDFTGNHTSPASASDGGALYSLASTVTIERSRFVLNAAHAGGAIFHDNNSPVPASVLAVSDSTFLTNTAETEGGAIRLLDAYLRLSASTFAANSAAAGGGLWSSTADGAIENMTFSENHAGTLGGGIFNAGALEVTNVTLSGNSANSSGGGLHHAAGNLALRNSVFANSPLGGDCVKAGGNLTANVHNLVEDGGCGASFTGDPLLGPLADYGGPTLTFALLTGSVAVDAGSNAGCTEHDQRGTPRPQDGDHVGAALCDLGAFELVYGGLLPRLYLPLVLRP